MKNRQLAILLLLLLTMLSGCQLGPKPRARMGCYPSSTLGTTFLDPDNLGPHAYHYNPAEKNGIIYTCKTGHIDIAHLRIAADWTRYLQGKSYKCFIKGKKDFSFKLTVEPSKYFVEISYPAYWEYLGEEDRKQIAKDVSIELAQYLTFTATTWHEIITWYGYKCIAFFPEFPSAFSWEDNFSNLLGTHISARVLTQDAKNFDRAFTYALDQELEKLDPQPASVARQAAAKMKGQWYSGSVLFAVNMKHRSFDIGLEDGQILPITVPDIASCDYAKPLPYKIPNLGQLSFYGFSIDLKIKPREWEKNRILNIVYPDKKAKKNYIEPSIHFAPILEQIQKEARKKFGNDINASTS